MRKHRVVSRTQTKKQTSKKYATSLTEKVSDMLYVNTSAEWRKSLRAVVLKRFHAAHERVPAYRHFLKRQNIDPSKIRTINQLDRIPTMGKANYLRVHPWEKLCCVDLLAQQSLVLTATSGSTGQSFYIPRTDEIHEASRFYHDLFLDRSGLDRSKPTLVVVAFGMGVWIGGILTYEAFRRISERSWPLSIITPGVNKKEIFEALTHIGQSYDQIILCGYPPFIKDVIDDGPEHGVNWKRWEMRIVCAAEAFSEHFRDYLMHKTKAKDPYRSIMNIYGSAELGTMATETPLSILLRRLALKHKALYAKLFREAHRLPTLAQFVPELVSFEEGKSGEVLVTGGSALPFVRYDIGDQGGVFQYKDAFRFCTEVGIDLEEEVQRARIHDTVAQLPFVYLYERADLSIKLYGAAIFPEHVKIGLQNKAFEKKLTGRFTMLAKTDEQHNQFFELHVELQRNAQNAEAIRAQLTESIVKSLASSSGEYRNNYLSMRERVLPHIVFWPHEDPTYFSPVVKQKWVVKS